MTHEPLGKQQAPCGQVELLPQSTFAPWNTPPAPAQLVWVSTRQNEPLFRQHAPVGCGQFAVAQSVPKPRKVPLCAEQSFGLVMMQLPLGKQHAPPQLAVAQVVPSPLYVPPAVEQSVWVMTLQLPSGKQHEPTPGVQERLEYVARITISPRGRQPVRQIEPMNWSAMREPKGVQPAAHPPAQLLAKIQFCVGKLSCE